MSYALDNAIDRAGARAQNYLDIATRAVDGVAARLGSTGDGGGVGGMLNRPATLAHHAEQLKHFVGWPYAAIKVIAQRIAGQALRIAKHVKAPAQKRRPGKKEWNPRNPLKSTLPDGLKSLNRDLEVLETHPFIEAVNRPNEIMVRFTLLFVTMASLELTGKAYWWIYDAPKGSAFKGRKLIWPVPSSWVEPKHTKDRLFDSYEVRVDGTSDPVTVPGNEIVYFYYPDPANPLGAASPLQAQARSVVADEQISDAQRRVFATDLWPGLALVIGRNPDAKELGGSAGERPHLKKDQRASIIAAIKRAYQGVQKYGEPLILDGLIEDVKRVSNSPRELDFMKSGAYTKERIVQGFGVNPIVMGQVEGVNRASSAAADDHFCKTTLGPKVELISQTLTVFALPMFDDDESLVAYLEMPQADDPDMRRADRQQLITAGALDNNALRAEEGLPPIHGGQIAFMPAGLKPVHIVLESDPEPDGPARFPGETEENNSDPPPPTPPARPGVGANASGDDNAGDASDEGADAEGEEKARRRRGQRKPTLSRPEQAVSLVDVYALRGLCPARSIGRIGILDIWTRAQGAGEKRLQKAAAEFLKDETAALIATYRRSGRINLDGAGFVKRYQKAVKPALEYLAFRGALEEWHLYLPAEGKSPDVDALRAKLPASVDDEIDDFLKRSFKQPWWKDVPVRIREQAEDAVRAGLDKGEPTEAVVDRLTIALEDGNRSRAENVARTETTGALNAGHEASRKELAEMGLITGKEWLSLEDKDTREDHADANGQRVKMDEQFEVGGEKCDYPGDQVLSPGQRCNCRCVSVSTFDAPEDEAKEWLSWTKEQCRDEAGRFTDCGGGGGAGGAAAPSPPKVDSSKLPASQVGLLAAAKTLAKGWITKIKELPQKLMDKARTVITKKYEQLSERYGSRFAKCVIGAGIVGLPIPVPFASLVLAAPVMGAAELYRKFMKDGAEIDMDQMYKVAEKFWEDTLRQWAAHVPKFYLTFETKEQCRDDIGRFISCGDSGPADSAAVASREALHRSSKDRFRDYLKANTTLTTEQRQAYYGAASLVLSRMPAKGLQSFLTSTKDAKFFASAKELSAQINSEYQARGQPLPIKEGHTIAGCYKALSQQLLLDGGAGKMNTAEIYAHEFTHALDGPMKEMSRSAEWQKAYKDEIAGGRLSEYAKNNEAEGFAEFGRLLYGSGYKRSKIEEQFPKAAAFFRSRELW